MLRLPPFQFRIAKTLNEAAEILVGEGVAEHEDNVRLVAGGTDLWPNMKRRHQKARTVVSLMSVPGLKGIDVNGDTRIGATTIPEDPASVLGSQVVFPPAEDEGDIVGLAKWNEAWQDFKLR